MSAENQLFYDPQYLSAAAVAGVFPAPSQRMGLLEVVEREPDLLVRAP